MTCSQHVRDVSVCSNVQCSVASESSAPLTCTCTCTYKCLCREQPSLVCGRSEPYPMCTTCSCAHTPHSQLMGCCIALAKVHVHVLSHRGCTDSIFLSRGGCTDSIFLNHKGCADSMFLSRRGCTDYIF